MYKLTSWLAVGLPLVLVGLQACSVKNGSASAELEAADKNQPVAIVPLQWEKRSIEKGYEACIPRTGRCSYVSLQFPEFTAGTHSMVLNSFINMQLSNVAGKDSQKAIYPDSIVGLFFQEYAAYRQSQPRQPQVWFLEQNMRVLHETTELLCLSVYTHRFKGQGKALVRMDYANFDLNSGKRLQLANIIENDKIEQLNQLVEQKFRQIKKLSPQDDLKQKAKLFKTSIEANGNFAISAEGIIFYYNAGDIAPEEAGHTTIFLSYGELEGLLREIVSLPLGPSF